MWGIPVEGGHEQQITLIIVGYRQGESIDDVITTMIQKIKIAEVMLSCFLLISVLLTTLEPYLLQQKLWQVDAKATVIMWEYYVFTDTSAG